MKFEHLNFPDDKNAEVMEKKSILRKLEKIKNACHKKFHHSYSYPAVYEAMKTRCIVHSNETQDLVIKSVFDKMIKEYKTGQIGGPHDFSAEEFNPLIHMFVKGQVSEC